MRLIRGDTWSPSWTWVRDDAPVDVSSVSEATFTMRRQEDDDAVLTVPLVTDPSRPGVLAMPPQTQTQGYDGGYVYDIELVWSDGTVQTLMIGRIVVLKDVSHG